MRLRMEFKAPLREPTSERMSTEAERKALGDYLRGVREAMKLTHGEVEKMTDGTASAEYVRALEAGEVRLPAPFVLYALAGAYVVSYEKLIELAGHVRPKPMKVKIERCSQHGAWWSEHVGKTVDVFAVDGYGYWTRDTGPMRLSQWIACEDAVIVEPKS